MDFADLKTVTADQLMYVKEDLIIPQTNTFYDFIVIKARGKSGPLFAFDVHDDVRLVNDASVEKDESHAGKKEAAVEHLLGCNSMEIHNVGHKTYKFLDYFSTRALQA